MNVITGDSAVMSAGISPEELAVMRQAGARLNQAPAVSAPDPFTALTSPFTPGAPGRVEWWHKEQGHSHYCF